MNYIQYNTNGQILCVGSAPDGSDLSDLGLVLMIEEQFNADLNEHYVASGKIVRRPTKPSPHHTWYWSTKSWLPDLDAAFAASKQEIDRERDRRISLPLSYDGKVLDADQAARDNLKAKLEEVRERIRLNMLMMPELLVWRDNANVTHSWPTIEAYHDWLAGYAVAMSDRGTRCYACAWHHKDTVGQLSTVVDVISYNITYGWPA